MDPWQEFSRSLPFNVLLSTAGIVIAVNGGKIAAHRLLATRLFSIRGAPAVVIGIAMLGVGLAALATAWMRGIVWS